MNPYEAETLSGKARLTLAFAALDGAVRYQRVGKNRFFHREDVLAFVDDAAQAL